MIIVVDIKTGFGNLVLTSCITQFVDFFWFIGHISAS